MPLAPRRNTPFAVLLSAALLWLPVLGSDAWSAAPAPTAGPVTAAMLTAVPVAASSAGSPPCAAVAPEAEKAAILKVIANMQAAWNRGDFRGYMQGFKNPDVIFVSGGRFQDGWQGTLDHYVRDYGTSAETRGTLRFYDIRIEMLGPDAAQLISRYELVKQLHPQYGINTRLMRKVNGEWVIALNHVSSTEIPPVQTVKDKH